MNVSRRLRRTAVLTIAASCLSLVGCPAASSREVTDVTAGRTPVFVADFRPDSLGTPSGWGWQSGAYSRCTSNPGEHKLDVLTRSSAFAMQDGALTITAHPRPDGQWNTGLLTTGDSCSSGGSGFQERTGDLVVAHVRLPDSIQGAWPSLWSWRAGASEVDLMEWHSAAPHRLEFVNHVRPTSLLWTSSRLVRPGAWLWVGVQLGAQRVTWYVGTTLSGITPEWHDDSGVGSHFAAYPVISLSVDDGTTYPRPTRSAHISFTLDAFRVYRPTASATVAKASRQR